MNAYRYLGLSQFECRNSSFKRAKSDSAFNLAPYATFLLRQWLARIDMSRLRKRRLAQPRYPEIFQHRSGVSRDGFISVRHLTEAAACRCFDHYFITGSQRLAL